MSGEAGGSGGADPSGETPLGRTLVGFAVGGALFLALGLYLNVATGFGPADNPGPVAVLALIGATVGGLVAPMFSSLVRRWRDGGDGSR